MIFHLEKEKYRDHTSAFYFWKSVERQEDLEGKTQGKSKTRRGEDCDDVYICIYLYVYVDICMKFESCSGFQTGYEGCMLKLASSC